MQRNETLKAAAAALSTAARALDIAAAALNTAAETPARPEYPDAFAAPVETAPAAPVADAFRGIPAASPVETAPAPAAEEAPEKLSVPAEESEKQQEKTTEEAPKAEREGEPSDADRNALAKRLGEAVRSGRISRDEVRRALKVGEYVKPSDCFTWEQYEITVRFLGDE